MAQQYDATLKAMLEVSPVDWPALAGYPATAVEVIDADVSTVSGRADKVLRVHGPPEWLMHVEFQSGPDSSLPQRSCLYNAVLDNRHDLPVRTVIVLLTRRANLSNLTGVYERGFEGEEPYLTFRYQVIRVWELPTETLLAGGLGTLPLAPISATTEAELPGVIGRMEERLSKVESQSLAKDLWAATYVLMGLRYERALVKQLLRGITMLEESTTYQEILEKGIAKGIAKGREEGREEGLAKGRDEGLREGTVRGSRKTLLRLGSKRFGPPGEAVVAAVETINDLDRLEQLADRLLDVKSWEELLALPH